MSYNIKKKKFKPETEFLCFSIKDNYLLLFYLFFESYYVKGNRFTSLYYRIYKF